MTRLDNFIIGVFCAALSLALAALVLLLMTRREISLSMTATLLAAGAVAMVVPALTATAIGRTLGPRGISGWLAWFAVACLLLAAGIGFLVT